MKTSMATWALTASILFALHGHASACDPQRADEALRVDAELVVEDGRFRLVSDPEGRAIRYRKNGANAEVQVWKGLGTDYAETRMFELAPGVVVVEDHLFETYEGEPTHLWTVVTPRSRIGFLESDSPPEFRGKAGGLSIDVTRQGVRETWTLCFDAATLVPGSLSCSRGVDQPGERSASHVEAETGER